MQSQLISDFPPWDKDCSLKNNFIICLDSDSGCAEFSFSMLLVKLIKQGICLQILSSNHSKAHYESILRKHAIDASKLQQDGLLAIDFIRIQCGRHETELLSSGPESSCDHISDPHIELDLFTLDESEYFWSELEVWQHKGMRFPLRSEKLKPAKDAVEAIMLHPPISSQYALLIDDLDALECIAPSSAAARSFLAKCHSRLGSHSPQPTQSSELSDTKNLHCIVAYGCNSLPSQGMERMGIFGSSFYDSMIPQELATTAIDLDSDGPSLTEYAKYRANVTVEVAPLSSGYSSEVHGIVRVCARNHAMSSASTSTYTTSSIHRDQERSGGSSGSVGPMGQGLLARSTGTAYMGSKGDDSDVSIGVGLWRQTLLFKALDTGVRCSLVST